MLQGPPKNLPKRPQDGHHGPSWAQLAANLAHLASILGPSSQQLHLKSLPDRARNLKKRPQRPQDHPGGRQRTPGEPLGPEFSWLQGRFWTSFFNCFCSLSFNSPWPPCLKFKARGGLARAAHWIIYYNIIL